MGFFEVREEQRNRLLEQRPPSEPLPADQRDFEGEAENGRIEHEVKPGDTAIGLSEEYDYLYPDEFEIAYPDVRNANQWVFTGDTIDFLTPSRMEKVREVKEIAAEAASWDELSPEAQDEVRGILGMDFMDGARGAGLDENQLRIRINERAADFHAYLPDDGGLEAVIDETRDQVVENVQTIMAQEVGRDEDGQPLQLRDVIRTALDNPDDAGAQEALRNAFISQMDATIEKEGDLQPDPDSGLLRRTEEKVIRDYTSAIMELVPEDDWASLGTPLNEAADEILVQRPAREIAGDYDLNKEGIHGWQDVFAVFDRLDSQTKTDGLGQPMSPERIAAIIDASAPTLEVAMRQLDAWSSLPGDQPVTDPYRQLSEVAARANAGPSGSDGVKTLARLLVQTGVFDEKSIIAPHELGSDEVAMFNPRANPSIYLRKSIEEGHGMDLGLYVAAELAGQGEEKDAAALLGIVRGAGQTFFDNAADKGAEFRRLFVEDPRYALHSLHGFMTPEEEQTFIASMQEKLQSEELSSFNEWVLFRDSNKDVYDSYYSNRQSIFAMVNALNVMPEGVKALDGYGDLEGLRDDTVRTLQTMPGADGQDADEYQENLRFAMVGEPFMDANSSPITAEGQQWLQSQEDEFFVVLLDAFDYTQSDENDGKLPPAGEELAQLRQLIRDDAGDDKAKIVEAMRQNPAATLAFAQHVYMCDEFEPELMGRYIPSERFFAYPEGPDGGPGDGNDPGPEVVGTYSGGFATRGGIRDPIVELIEKGAFTNPRGYFGHVFTTPGTAAPYAPGFGGDPAAEQALLRRAEARAIGWELKKGIEGWADYPRLAALGDRYYSADVQQGQGIYGHHPWVGPSARLALLGGGAAWGAYDFWPRDISAAFNPGDEDFNFWSDKTIYGVWGPWFVAAAAQDTALGGAGLVQAGTSAAGRTPPAWADYLASRAAQGKGLPILGKTLTRAIPPAMALLVAHEARKGDTFMAAAWAPGLVASTGAALGSTFWTGPVGLAAWAIAGVATFGVSHYRSIDSANRLEAPTQEGFEALGFPEDKARELADYSDPHLAWWKSEGGESPYPLVRTATEHYLGIESRQLFDEIFRDDAMSARDISYFLKLSKHIDVEPDDNGNYPTDIAGLDESDRYVLSLMYRLLPQAHRDGAPPPIFPDGELPKVWDGKLAWNDAQWLSDDTLLPWDDQQLPDGPFWKNGTYRYQPEFVKEAASYLYWRGER